jgi:hypothetical protein
MMTNKGIDLLDFFREPPRPPVYVGSTATTSTTVKSGVPLVVLFGGMLLVGSAVYFGLEAISKTRREVARQRGEMLREVGGVRGLLAMSRR